MTRNGQEGRKKQKGGDNFPHQAEGLLSRSAQVHRISGQIMMGELKLLERFAIEAVFVGFPDPS